jgi:hypothetical protein
MCDDLHTRQFCPIGVLKLLDASNKSVSGCLFLICGLGIPGSAPLRFFGSIERGKAVLLTSRRNILHVKPLFPTTLDGVSELHFKIAGVQTNADAHTSYIVDGFPRVVAAKVKDALLEAPRRLDPQEALTESDEDGDMKERIGVSWCSWIP